MGQTSIPAMYISKERSKTRSMSPIRRYCVEAGSSLLSIQVDDHKLTSGWLLSEVIRSYSGSGTIVALRTASNLDIIDWWLSHFDKKLTPVSCEERLVAVFEQPTGGSPSCQHFEVSKQIGRGAFSKVLLARKKDTGQLFAIKTMNKDFILQRKKTEQVANEKVLLSRLRHPFIVELHLSLIHI